MLAPDLKAEIDALWDKFWAGGLPNPVVAIDQINLLLFLRRLEEQDSRAAERSRELDEPHDSVFSDAEQSRWSWWKNLPAAEMFDHVQQVVVPWMRSLAEPDDPATTNLVRDANLVIPSAGLLAEAVATIERLNITDRNVDVQGDIYEYMLRQIQTAGALGQFRTPRHVIRSIVELVNPTLGEAVIDPACGTGGFLIAAHSHVLAAGTSPELLERDESGDVHNLVGDKYSAKEWEVLRDPPLTGLDVDPQFVRIATMNMVLHGIERPRVSWTNTLTSGFSHAPQADIVLANPPFAGSIDAADVSEEFSVRSTRTELLFLELFLDLLVPGGRAGVIVSEGALFSSSSAHDGLRRKLVDDNRLDAVIHLPSGVFKPYAPVSTAILILTKGIPTESTWMYEVSADGFTLDDNRLPTDENDLPDLLERWPAREESPRSFNVPIEQIRDNDYDLSAGRYRTIARQELADAHPRDLMALAAREADEFSARLEELRASVP